jgi:hypothetical protein
MVNNKKYGKKTKNHGATTHGATTHGATTHGATTTTTHGATTTRTMVQRQEPWFNHGQKERR